VSRKERELLRHREELLEATERLLEKKLLHDLTIQDIAAEAEFSVGYIYKLYENKAEIIAALITEKLRTLRGLIAHNVVQGHSWENRSVNLMNALSEWFLQTPVYGSRATPHLKDFACNNPTAAAEFASFLEFYRNSIAAIFAEAIEAGQLCEEQPGQAARTFRALIAGFSEESLLDRVQRPRGLAEEAPLIVRIMKAAFSPRGGDLSG
jgi:AcrR family transcriptional regulator